MNVNNIDETLEQFTELLKTKIARNRLNLTMDEKIDLAHFTLLVYSKLNQKMNQSEKNSPKE